MAELSYKQQTDLKNIQKIRLLESDVQGMMDGVSDPALKKALADLADAIHYSDAVTLPGLADVEERIARHVAGLQEELTDGNADALARVETIRQLLRERDRTAAILKR